MHGANLHATFRYGQYARTYIWLKYSVIFSIDRKSQYSIIGETKDHRVKVLNEKSDCRRQKFLFYLIIAISIGIRFPHVFKELSPYQFCDEVIWLNEVQRMISENSFVPNNFLSGSLSVIPAFLSSLFAKLIIGRNLDGDELTIVVRIFLIHGSLIGAAFIYRKLLRFFLQNEWMIVAGTAVLLLNPSSLAFSLYWYPDHYILLPAVFFYFTVVSAIVNRKSGRSQWVLIGIALAVLVSTKYTTLLAAAMLIPALIAKGKVFPVQISAARIVRQATIVFSVFAISFLALNYGVIFNPDKFIEDFLHNFHNYGQFKGGTQTLVFYLYTMLVSPFGLISFIFLVFGVVFVFRLNKIIGWSLICFPVLLVLSLSRSGLTITRNMAVLLPITSIFLICGLQEVISISKKAARTPKLLIFVFVSFSLGLPIGESISQFKSSLKQDSRVLASNWISENIPEYSSIGNNQGCSGPSPADTSGFKSIGDPFMDLQLDYYVINSFWFSPIFRHYETRSDQRYFHYYRFLNYGNPLFRQHTDITELIPSNYVIEKVFSGDGPEIVVLRRISN